MPMQNTLLESREEEAGAAESAESLEMRSQQLQRLWLVVPCYNDSGRLAKFLPSLLQDLQDAPVETNLLVVDDGSLDVEKNAVSKLVSGLQRDFPLLHAPLFEVPNQGKGAAILQGWDAANQTEWLGFVDADGAIPGREVKRVLKFIASRANENPKKAFFSSRVKMRGRKVERNLSRHVSGRIFATFVGMMIDGGIYDSQCGFKVIPAAVYPKIRPLFRERRFAFDVELLAALNHVGCPVEEVPIDWYDIPGSKVSLVRDSVKMFLAVRQIAERKRQWPPVG